eukprot:10404435-Prorocentrum_lima.AAC.1
MQWGGGVYALVSSTVILTMSTISGCSATAQGDGSAVRGCLGPLLARRHGWVCAAWAGAAGVSRLG